MEKIINQFLPKAIVLKNEILSGGLIHQTRKVTVEEEGISKVYVLQQFNANTFKEPYKVMKNLSLVQKHLSQQDYPLELPQAIETIKSKNLIEDDDGNFWRMFPFLKNSTSYDIPPSDDYLFEAGKAYGLFLTGLKDFDVEALEITIPNFHNLAQRFQTFLEILKIASPSRKEKAAKEIEQTLAFYHKFSIEFSNLPLRAVHNDSKLSNLLFDKDSQACVAVIDLDTLMPGYVVTDFGDMVRGMCNTSSEDEADLSKVSFDSKRYDLLEKGFLSATGDWLTKEEKDNLFNGAIYIILEQAIRFLGDYLNNDQYYSAKYPEHNFDRGRNQLCLLEDMILVNTSKFINR